jgi:hypothetical protein
VKLDLEGEQPTKEDRLAMAIIKKMKWSLDKDPTQAAYEDVSEYYRVTDDMHVKNGISNNGLAFVVLFSGADTFDNSSEVAKQLKAAGMSEEKISELVLNASDGDPSNPFTENPMNAYVKVIRQAFMAFPPQ